ncbi:hypothetical protein EDB83DRAFT_2432244 [Lactarius deliciosus]|nr:hypothetical protein EDB83DRAFT_2432244 [Lactarius deliciosus]
MKHALMCSGSRDVSSQLFTAHCRALGIPTRLVVSLRSVPWQTNVGRPKTPAKPKGTNSKGGRRVHARCHSSTRQAVQRQVTKVQSGGRGRREWWEQVMQTVTRPYKLVRDPDVMPFS